MLVKLNIKDKCKEILIKQDSITFAYVFGSHAKGTERPNSDVDIAIYLKKPMDAYECLDLKMQLTEALNLEVDLVVLNHATPLVKHQIHKNHLLLFGRDRGVETRYKIKTLFEYDDMKKYLDLAYNKTIDRLKKEVELNG